MTTMTPRPLSGAAKTNIEGGEAARKQRVKERLTKAKQSVTAQLMKSGDVVLVGMREFSVSDLDGLRLFLAATDPDGYQRGENREQVNRLLAVLEQGGIIPEPVAVVERSDGSLWIVDGGQRWRAHYLAQKPLQAVVYRVRNIEAERKMFNALNRTAKVPPGHIVHAWEGPAGDLMRWLAEHERSPLRGELDWGFGTGRGRFGVTALTRALAALYAGGSYHHHAILEQMQTITAAIRQIGMVEAQRRAATFTLILRDVFPERRPERTAVVALGAVTGERWRDLKDRPLTRPVASKLSRLNWSDIIRGEGDRWLRFTIDAVAHAWVDAKT